VPRSWQAPPFRLSDDRSRRVDNARVSVSCKYPHWEAGHDSTGRDPGEHTDGLVEGAGAHAGSAHRVKRVGRGSGGIVLGDGQVPHQAKQRARCDRWRSPLRRRAQRPRAKVAGPDPRRRLARSFSVGHRGGAGRCREADGAAQTIGLPVFALTNINPGGRRPERDVRV